MDRTIKSTLESQSNDLWISFVLQLSFNISYEWVVTTTIRFYRRQKTQYYLILFKPSSTQHTHWIQGVQQHWENTNPGKEKHGEATQFSPSNCEAAAWQATMVQPSLNISPSLLASCNQQLSNQQCTKTRTIISLWSDQSFILERAERPCTNSSTSMACPTSPISTNTETQHQI
jgi:hypothetical protein